MDWPSDEIAAGVAPDGSPADGAPPLPDGPLDGHEPATLLFPVVDGEVLLIHKKRGVGAGLYNGPGGTVEAGETVREAAVRETVEEVRAEPRGVAYAGELDFRFGDEPFTYVYVYRATGLAGTPEETAEADPGWFGVDGVPYDEMWEDDRHWLPHVLAGKSVAGTFRFDADGDVLRDWTLAVEASVGRE